MAVTADARLQKTALIGLLMADAVPEGAQIRGGQITGVALPAALARRRSLITQRPLKREPKTASMPSQVTPASEALVVRAKPLER